MPKALPDSVREKAERLRRFRACVRPPIAIINYDWDTLAEDLEKFLDAEYALGHEAPEKELSDKWYRERVPVVEGELECDEDALVSRSENGGAYVQTWAWVPAPAADKLEKDDD